MSGWANELWHSWTVSPCVSLFKLSLSLSISLSEIMTSITTEPTYQLIECTLPQDKLLPIYNLLRPIKLIAPEYRLVEKVECSRRMGYLFHSERQIAYDDHDELDKTFIQSPPEDKKVEFYGLHTYGGYYGFFRPDIIEVCNLIAPYINSIQSSPIDRIYVTTEMHPSAMIGECYDNEADRHRGKTTIWVIKQQES